MIVLFIPKMSKSHVCKCKFLKVSVLNETLESVNQEINNPSKTMHLHPKIGNTGCRNADSEVLFGMIRSFKKPPLNWLFLTIFAFDNWIK